MKYLLSILCLFVLSCDDDSSSGCPLDTYSNGCDECIEDENGASNYSLIQGKWYITSTKNTSNGVVVPVPCPTVGTEYRCDGTAVAFSMEPYITNTECYQYDYPTQEQIDASDPDNYSINDNYLYLSFTPMFGNAATWLIHSITSSSMLWYEPNNGSEHTYSKLNE